MYVSQPSRARRDEMEQKLGVWTRDCSVVSLRFLADTRSLCLGMIVTGLEPSCSYRTNRFSPCEVDSGVSKADRFLKMVLEGYIKASRS